MFSSVSVSFSLVDADQIEGIWHEISIALEEHYRSRNPSRRLRVRRPQVRRP